MLADASFPELVGHFGFHSTTMATPVATRQPEHPKLHARTGSQAAQVATPHRDRRDAVHASLADAPFRRKCPPLLGYRYDLRHGRATTTSGAIARRPCPATALRGTLLLDIGWLRAPHRWHARSSPHFSHRARRRPTTVRRAMSLKIATACEALFVVASEQGA